jgi:hypothetical protein
MNRFSAQGSSRGLGALTARQVNPFFEDDVITTLDGEHERGLLKATAQDRL